MDDFLTIGADFGELHFAREKHLDEGCRFPLTEKQPMGLDGMVVRRHRDRPELSARQAFEER